MRQLRLNPAIDVEQYAREFAAKKCVQVVDLFEPSVAEALERTLQTLPWRLVCQNDAEENLLLTGEELAAMTEQQQTALEEGIRERAARSIGYTYFMYPMILARLQNWDAGHPIHAVTDFMNSEPFFDFAKRLTSYSGITKVDVHASQYGPGHYLTAHRDDDPTKHGRAAYTIGFSRDWRVDWGGSLLFLDKNEDIVRGFIPRFNMLTVFDGLIPHTVTAVSQFAPRPRLSLAGWFRDDPPTARR